MAEIFPNSVKNINEQIQESEKNPNRVNPYPYQIKIKFLKAKDNKNL